MIRIVGRFRALAVACAVAPALFASGCTIVRHEALEPSPLSVARRDTVQVESPALLAEVDSLRGLASSQAQRLASLGALNTELSNKVAILNDRIKALEDHIQSLTAPPAQKPRGPKKSSPKALSTPSHIKTLYQNALRDFEARRFENALKGFSEVLASGPKEGLADNAQYWIGECYYGLKNYAQAIKEFQKVFAYPKTWKDDDAQLKIGLCYKEMGEVDKAIVELKRLTVDYPESEYIERAEALLRNLQASKEKH